LAIERDPLNFRVIIASLYRAKLRVSIIFFEAKTQEEKYLEERRNTQFDI
jgi:hypothetical protein